MTKLEHLIQELCPDGVEYKEIDDLSKTIAPKIKIKSKDYLEKGVYPIIDQGQNYIGGYSNNSSVFPKGQYIVFGDHTCVVKYVDFPFLQGADGVKVLQPISDKILLTKYLYYCMCNIKIAVNYSRHWSKMRKSTIPLPPIEVQAEIVRILDKFTELTTELTAELANRKKQYEYYRDKLLSSNTNIKYKLSELFDTRNGYTPSKSNYSFWNGNTCIPWFRMEDIRENGRLLDDSTQHVTPKAVKGNLFPADSIIISTSATIGEHALITVPSLANQRFTYLMLKPEYKEIIDIRYIFYYCFKLGEYCRNHLNQGNFASVDMVSFGQFEFLIPSIDRQKQIVSILDRFDKLCNDISEGLPAEIEARQKQYEYYRDKLLTFTMKE